MNGRHTSNYMNDTTQARALLIHSSIDTPFSCLLLVNYYMFYGGYNTSRERRRERVGRADCSDDLSAQFNFNFRNNTIFEIILNGEGFRGLATKGGGAGQHAGGDDDTRDGKIFMRGMRESGGDE